MNKIILIVIAMTFSQISQAVLCTTASGWELQFNYSNADSQYTEVKYGKGADDDAPLKLLQAYMGASHFMALVDFDQQKVRIETTASGKDGEYTLFRGVISKDGENPEVVTCSGE